MEISLPSKVAYIIDTLERNGFEAYAVGGCVRDSVLGLAPADWDITTSAKPEEVKACFRRTVDTGIQHGTVTVMLEKEGFEVTTYRIDGAYSDGRHPDKVTFTPDLAEDLKRRDFTINAMAYSRRTGIIDYFNGIKDLKEHTIRCVGNPSERFDEDALRIMRAVRFAARFGFRIEDETYRAIAAHAEDLKKISAERIRDELMKTICSPNPMYFREFYQLGITKVILPEFDVCMETPQHNPHHKYNVGEHILHTMDACDPSLRLVMLLHDIGKPEVRRTDPQGMDHFRGHGLKSAEMADGILRRLRFDNETRKRTVHLIRFHDLRPRGEEADVRRAAAVIGRSCFCDYLNIQKADNAAKSNYLREEKLKRLRDVEILYKRILERGDCLTIGELAINGDDLLAAGIRGKEIGEKLNRALQIVLEDPAKNVREMLLGMLLPANNED